MLLHSEDMFPHEHSAVNNKCVCGVLFVFWFFLPGSNILSHLLLFLSDLHSRSSREAEADEEEMQNRDGEKNASAR